MITTGMFLDSFKISKITLLFKKSDVSMLSSYRPISLLIQSQRYLKEYYIINYMITLIAITC